MATTKFFTPSRAERWKARALFKARMSLGNGTELVVTRTGKVEIGAVDIL